MARAPPPSRSNIIIIIIIIFALRLVDIVLYAA
jgi:hypothetical protein